MKHRDFELAKTQADKLAANFLKMMQAHEEFEVETDEPGEWPLPFSSETVRQVVMEWGCSPTYS